MAKSKYEPAIHDHKTFLKNARKREGFSKAYNDLEENLLLSTRCYYTVSRLIFH